jgi:hypothetical protein
MPKNEEQYDQLDQTRFSVEEPMFEGLAALPVEEKAAAVVKVPLLKQKRVIIALIVGTIIFVVLLLVVINAIVAGQRRPQVVEATPLPMSGTPSDAAFLEKKVKALQSELEAADPNKRELTFPSVDLNIRIDKEE